MMRQSTKDAESVVYCGIYFQNKAGSLVLTAEKLVFRQDTGSDDSAWTRSWLWASIKRSLVIQSSDDNNDLSVQHAIKICNYSNKAVIFHVPESVVVGKLQEDISSRMANPKKTMHKKSISTGDAVHRDLKLAQAYKAQDNSSVSTIETVTTTVVTTVTTTETSSEAFTSQEPVIPGSKPTSPKLRKTRSNSAQEASTKPSTLTRRSSNPEKAQKKVSFTETMPEFFKDLVEPANTAPSNTFVSEGPNPGSKPTSPKPKKTRSNSAEEAPGLTRRSSNPERSPKKVSLMHATKVITHDLFVKPSQQLAHDLVVRPTNTLIVKPVRQGIINPAQEKIIKPVQQRLAKPAQEELVNSAKKDNPPKQVEPTKEETVGPVKQAAQKMFMSPKIIAQDMGILPGRGSRPETIEESERSDTMDCSGSGRRAPNKKPFLYFLKAPPRRTFSEDLSTESFEVPSDGKEDEQPKVEDEKPTPPRKSAGSKLFSSMKNPMKARPRQSIPEEQVVLPKLNIMARSAA